jgi:hypothetical protein
MVSISEGIKERQWGIGNGQSALAAQMYLQDKHECVDWRLAIPDSRA